MAIKNKQRRDTYRSNVKVRPLRQNGLEAQNQGLDVNEINIDHAGLPILGRGGYQNRQRYTKVQKEYVVDVSDRTYHPFATITFDHRADLWQFNSSNPNPRGLADDYDGAEIPITAPNASAAKTYKFYKSPPSGKSTGDVDSSNKVIVDLSSNTLAINSVVDLFNELTGAIESTNGHGKRVFTFEYGPTDLTGITGLPTPNQTQTSVPANSIRLTLVDTEIGSPAAAVGTPANLPYTSPNQAALTKVDFKAIDGVREWALNGYKELETDNKFYEDIRTDHLQVAIVHKYKHPEFNSIETFDSAGNTLTYPRWGTGLQTFKNDWLGITAGTPIINLEGILSGSAGTGNADRDPTTSNFTLDPYSHNPSVPLIHKKLSEEVKIRSVPLRDPLFAVHREDGDVPWYEDPYWKDVNQRTWTNVQNRYSQWHSTFIEHVAGTHHENNPGIMDGIYYRVEDIPDEPLTGRIDCGLRVSRSVYGLLDSLASERHPFSFLNQFLEERRDPINIQENRYPVADRYTRDLAADDNIGRRFEDGWPVPTNPNSPYLPYLPGQNDGDNPIIFNNYYDQLPIDTHDFVDSPVYYSSIDEQMQQVMSDASWDHDNDPTTPKVETNRTLLLDRREWQDSQHVITGTGFINSQSTRQSGIVYREMLR